MNSSSTSTDRYWRGLGFRVPKIRGPQHRPQNTIIRILGTPKKVMLGNYQIGIGVSHSVDADDL